MNCARWEERLALFVEGDLPAREAGPLEAHLGECAACREFASALGESQAAVKELGSEALDQTLLDGVRRRVMARVAERRAPAPFDWWRVWAPAAAVVAAVLAVWLWPRVPEVAPPRVMSAAIPPAPAAPALVWPRPVRRAAAVTTAAPAAEPLLMRIVTNDPDVVIYWIVECKQKGD